MIAWKLVICGLSAVLWAVGGQTRGSYRDVPIPIILALWYAITLSWWLGAACLATFQVIRLGYGAYDPEHDSKPSFLASITHDRSGVLVRSIYCFLVGLATLPVALYTHKWLGFGVYVGLLTLCGYIVTRRKWIVLPTDLLIGAGVASIVFLI